MHTQGHAYIRKAHTMEACGRTHIHAHAHAHTHAPLSNHEGVARASPCVEKHTQTASRFPPPSLKQALWEYMGPHKIVDLLCDT
eukprot:scaffold34305_cov26-Tisochrysis_lutea.AAC.2